MNSDVLILTRLECLRQYDGALSYNNLVTKHAVSAASGQPPLWIQVRSIKIAART